MIDKNDPRLTAFVLNELSEQEQTEIQKAVAADPELQRAIDQIRQTVALVETEFASLEPVELTPQHQVRIDEAIATADQDTVSPEQLAGSVESAATPPPRRRPIGWIFGLAAAIAVVLMPILYYQGMLTPSRLASNNKETELELDRSRTDHGDSSAVFHV